KSTETLTAKLNQSGFEAQAYHAGLNAEERSRIQEDFVNDRTPIIVATIAFGMGIDKSNVRWVIHYNMPKNIEGYYQEIGRSGRDSLPAQTLLFYSFADVVKLRQFIEESPNRKYQLAKLERMQQFAEALSCRRIALLNYFGEHIFENCGNCDNCKNPPRFFDGTLLAQKVCSAVARLEENEAPGMVVDVLRGSQNATVFEKGYQQIKTYGAVKDVSWQDLHQYVIQLINQGVLEIRFHQGGRLLRTPLAKAILFEGKKLKLATLAQQPKKEKIKEQSVKGEANNLIEKLRKLRQLIAKEENMPAYIIFSDASLKNMEEELPATKEEFSRISGVGKVKEEKYANRFLQVINRHRETNEIGLPTRELTLKLFQDGFSPEEIAEKRFLRTETVFSHLFSAYKEGNLEKMRELISSEEILKIKKAKKELEDPEKLRPYFEYLEEKIPYWKIKLGL